MIIAVACLSLIAAVLAFKLFTINAANKELTEKIVSSRNELLKTKKELEDLTKAYTARVDDSIRVWDATIPGKIFGNTQKSFL